MMSDGRNPESICADCSMPNPTWASLNRGVLLCPDCCGVHRSLGRHISYIKSLHTTNWSPAVREMVSSLVRKGANSIWEHSLHDSSASKVKIRKPGHRDRIHPTKYDFIVAKYKHLALLPRMTVKETANMTEDMSKQLHASVRTSNLETCLRLLSMGADPNYLHPDRGNTPLHVAAHANQSMQVELLIIYGANPTALDLLGHTPEECARIAGHHQLANRLIESQYELTDRLSFFLSGRKPSHDNGEHYLIPQGPDLNDGGGSEARNKLQQLSNNVFEELATDIFDEVDRRETDAIWLTTQSLQDSVAFLPVNPALSPMRNQGRQKLATLDGKQFSQLVLDVLTDTKRRQNISLETGHRSGNVVPTSGNLLPEHDYDDVAFEEEESQKEGQVKLRHLSKLTPPVESTYSIIGEDQIIFTEPDDEQYSHLHGVDTKMESTEEPIRYSLLSGPLKTISNDGNYSTLSDASETPKPKDKHPLFPDRPRTTYEQGIKGRHSSLTSPRSTVDDDTVSRQKFDIIMEQLRKVQKEKEQLTIVNEQLSLKLNDIQRQLNKVITENVELKNSATPEPTTPKSPLSPLDSPVPLPTSPPQFFQQSLPLPPSINHPNNNNNFTTEPDNIYSAIAKKPKPIPPGKKPLMKTWSTPNKRNPGSPLPYSTTPPLSKVLTSPSKKPSLGSIESTSSNEITINEDFKEDVQEDSAYTPPPIPPHHNNVSPSNTRVSSPPKPPVASPKSQGATPKHTTSSVSTDELPPLDQVHKEIKAITMCIQELLKAGQSQKHHMFQSCSISTTTAVDKLIDMFPPKPASQNVDNSIQRLSKASSNLAAECQNSAHTDQAQQTRLIMNGAYDVAKAARHLVTCVENAQ